MRLIYDLFFIIFSIFYIPYLLVKRKAHRDFFQKLGFLPREVTILSNPVWIHAVSVGEAALAAKLAADIKCKFKDTPVIVSTTTQTGNNMIRKLANGNVDAVFYYPIDMRMVTARVVRLLKPRLYVMVETELWPNLLEELYSKDVPVVIANGRISDGSFENYKKIRFVTRRILKGISCFCMQSDRDAERIQELGASSEKVFVTGNMKFDEKDPVPFDAVPGRERWGFNANDEIVVAGSTHCPEENEIIDIYKDLKADRKNLKLVLAPRHIERAEAIKIHVEKEGLKCRCLSGSAEDTGYDVLLVDTIGHLKDIYGIATVVFIGGSLVKKGGQNPIEAARWGKAVVFGPHMFNFREVSDIFLEHNAAFRVKDKRHLKDLTEELLNDPEKRDRAAEGARKVIEENTGAVSVTIEKVEEYL